jgi:membrane protease YdiL (CAAX protease family)
VLIWVWQSKSGWAAVGLARPKSWISTVATGIVIGLAFRAFTALVLLPAMHAPAVNPAFKHLQGNLAALPMAILMMCFVNAFGEELVMRGFFFERLTGLIGRSVAALAFIALLTAAIFGIGHYPLQGLFGAVHAFLGGLVFAALYIRSRTIWLPIVTHGAYNLAGLAMIYFGLHWTNIVRIAGGAA